MHIFDYTQSLVVFLTHYYFDYTWILAVFLTRYPVYSQKYTASCGISRASSSIQLKYAQSSDDVYFNYTWTLAVFRTHHYFQCIIISHGPLRYFSRVIISCASSDAHILTIHVPLRYFWRIIISRTSSCVQSKIWMLLLSNSIHILTIHGPCGISDALLFLVRHYLSRVIIFRTSLFLVCNYFQHIIISRASLFRA